MYKRQVKLFTNELDVEGKCLTPYLVQGSDAFQLSGNQSKFCKEGVLMFYLGIDIGKRTHVASIMNAEGKVVLKGFSFANSLDGAHALLERLTSFSDSTDDFLVGMEATGHYLSLIHIFIFQFFI